MAEYIKRETLLKDIEEERPVNWSDSEAERQAESDFYKYKDIVMMQPTADVVEVKHGEWMKEEDYLYKCSLCGDKAFLRLGGKPCNYCPSCGAKMDLKEGADE